jgi:hypothetical protein
MRPLILSPVPRSMQHLVSRRNNSCCAFCRVRTKISLAAEKGLKVHRLRWGCAQRPFPPLLHSPRKSVMELPSGSRRAYSAI